MSLPDPPHAARLSSDTIAGLIWMALSGTSFAIMTGVARHAAVGLDPLQAPFLRYSMGIAFVLPFLFRRGRFIVPRTRQLGRHLVRGAIHAMGTLLWFVALVRIPLADVQALSFLSPVFVVLGAMMFLGEARDPRRIAVVLVAFAGTIVILRPTGQAIDLGAVALLVSAPIFAVSELMDKSITRTESGPNVVFFQAIIVTLALLPVALYVWKPPTAAQVGWMAVVAILATLGHIAWMRALIVADVSVTQPVKFLQLPLVAAVGLAAFGEVPDIFTLLGGAIIFASATYVASREARHAGRARTPT
ncbi:MAG: DMT family transporter [Alphaproteobacteria bacterium]|nr:DMT family transporter [Alphaproteobacteria bacterium]